MSFKKSFLPDFPVCSMVHFIGLIGLFLGACLALVAYSSSDGVATISAATTTSGISVDAKATVASGTLQGTVMASGVRSFLGVPYAAPPLGSLRWKPPQPVAAWTGTKLVQTMPPVAIWSSAPVTLSGMTTPWPTSEDCLYLNMWVPPESTLPASGKWPVYVWIHGSNGDILQTRYLGDELAKKGIIYVLPARRQGVFAGLALAALSAENENKGYSGNFDLLDEIFALQWVHDNIAKFGGDPDNVTLSGQSGGSRSSARLQASPLAKGLFKRILAQSHTPFTNGTKPRTPTSLAAAEAKGAAWMAKFGTVAGTSAAATVADLRGKSTAEILLVSGAPGALAGGICLALPDSEENIFLAGNQNDVPIYIGSDYDEGNTGPIIGVTDLASYDAALSAKFGADATTVFNFYPAFNNADAVTRAKRLNADYTEGIQELAWARLQKMKGKSPVYMWSFRRANSVGEVRHGWENPYWHGKLTAAYSNNTYPYATAGDYQLSERMMDSLVSYCRTGNPNTTYVTVPEYKPGDEKWVAFDVGAISVVPIPASVGYFLDNLGKW